MSSSSPAPATRRLTVAQAIVQFLARQYSERDGMEQRLIPGCFGIFGHGNVAGVAQAQGPGAYTLRPALFSPLANLRPLIGGQGINVIRLTAPGEGRAELDRATELAPHVRAALQAIPGGRGLNVQESKRKDFDAQVKQVDRTRGLYTALSLFIALAGAALVVNLGLALAEERRPRHAVLRALGLSRAGMVALSLVEGALYSLAAGVMALVPGALFGLALVALLYVRVNSVAVDNRTAPVQYAVSFSAIALSVAIGALIVLATLLATSVRSSRMQISSAIKNLPEPTPRRKRSVWRTALLVGLGLGSLAALVIGTLPVRLAGGVGLVILAAALVGGRISDRLRGDFDRRCDDGVGGGQPGNGRGCRHAGIRTRECDGHGGGGLRAQRGRGSQPSRARGPAGLASRTSPCNAETIARLSHPAAAQGRPRHRSVRACPGLDDSDGDHHPDVQRPVPHGSD